MARDVVHQALYGYVKGHRMLAASRPIPTEAGRVLRAATDTGVERPDKRYLTVLPIPELRSQAFISTWAAEERIRPGSVWSHVLLVDFVTLANADRLRGILSAFRRPFVEPNAFEPALDPYRVELSSADVLGAAQDSKHSIDLSMTAEVLEAIYASNERATITVPDTAVIEEILFEVYEQQWPRLRRSFAFRTRLRSSDGTVPFDLEVVERSRVNRKTVQSRQDSWVVPLLRDIDTVSGDLRKFFRAFGSESSAGRPDVPKLVEIYSSVTSADPESSIVTLTNAYPGPKQMQSLKRSLLSERSEGVWTPPKTWPTLEVERLTLLIQASAAVDYNDLKVPGRLAFLIERSPASAAAMLHDIDLEHVPADKVHTLVNAVIAATSEDAAIEIAVAQPDLGVLLVAQRPTLLGRSAVWDVLDSDLLLELFDRAPEDKKRNVLLDLLDASADHALTTLCTATPVIWWDLLLVGAQSAKNNSALEVRTSVLRRVLPRVGAAAIGNPPREPASEAELLGLLLSAEIGSGLWRHVPARAWLKLWQDSPPKQGALRDRVATITFLATSAGPRQLRVDGWQATFSALHDALGHPGFDDESWAALASALPAAPEWDRCLRLRRGAVSEIRRDHWTSTETAVLLGAAGKYRDEMGGELQVRATTTKKKRKKHWLRELVDSILP